MGTGYWFWLIPLASGSTSIGLVFDPAIHPVRAVNTMDRLMKWLHEYEPVMADALEPERADILDFNVLRHFAHDSKQLFSPNQWALTGEAGLFLDPFYSPGSDFIAISNSLISELIGEQSPGRKAAIFQHLYRSIFDATLPLYQHQYPGFGDRDLMTLKTTWDYAYYWSVIAFIFFTGKHTDIAFLEQAQPVIDRARTINLSLQSKFRSLGSLRRQLPAEGRFIDHYAIGVLTDLKRQLIAPPGKEMNCLTANVNMLDALASLIERELGNCAAEKRLGRIEQISGLDDIRRHLSPAGS
jgi:hypothetical protein